MTLNMKTKRLAALLLLYSFSCDLKNGSHRGGGSFFVSAFSVSTRTSTTACTTRPRGGQVSSTKTTTSAWRTDSRRLPQQGSGWRQTQRSATVESLSQTTPADDVGISSPLEEKNERDDFVWLQQWYPVLPSSYLEGRQHPAEPIPMTILGKNLVIWQSNNSTSGDDMQFSIMEDTCPHRRAPLSTGKVVENTKDGSSTLMCRYHGWEFDTAGTCAKIPMMNDEDPKQQKVNRIHVPSYPVQQAGGLLWVFMDPFLEEDKIPELDPNLLPFDNNHDSSSATVWAYNVHPLSYQSMIENSFDPSHAPFTHEGVGFGGSVYSPDTAIPMEKYQLVPGTEISQAGFTLEHTPYKQFKASSENPDYVPMTQRTFMPPCTNLVKDQFFTSRLYFVPLTPTTCATVTFFQLPAGNPKGRFVQFVQKRLIPQSWKDTIGNWIHVKFSFSERNMRFLSQDRLTMQGQDNRKWQDLPKQSWDDMVVTPSDQGVATFQRWIRKYAHGGPFATLENKILGTVPPPTQHTISSLSKWESHGKYCPKCQAALKQAARWQKSSSKGATLALLASVGVAALSWVNQLVFAQRTLPVVLRNLSRFLPSPTQACVAMVMTSVMLKYISKACQDFLQDFFRQGDQDPTTQMRKVYEF